MLDDQGDQLRIATRAVLASEPGVVPDVALGLARVCRAAAAELGLDRVSVTLMGDHATYAVVASSPEDDGGLEPLQFDLGEGPSREAYAGGRAVLVPDLRGDLGRWPGFASVALERGVASVYAFPLQLGAMRFGVLTGVAVRPRPLERRELSAAMIFAEVATELLLDSSPNGDHPGPDLGASLHVHSEVFQAQGMVTVDLGVSLDVALARMRAVAFAEGLTLPALAAQILTGRRLDRHLPAHRSPSGGPTTESSREP